MKCLYLTVFYSYWKDSERSKLISLLIEDLPIMFSIFEAKFKQNNSSK